MMQDENLQSNMVSRGPILAKGQDEGLIIFSDMCFFVGFQEDLEKF